MVAEGEGLAGIVVSPGVLWLARPQVEPRLAAVGFGSAVVLVQAAQDVLVLRGWDHRSKIVLVHDGAQIVGELRVKSAIDSEHHQSSGALVTEGDHSESALCVALLDAVQELLQRDFGREAAIQRRL